MSSTTESLLLRGFKVHMEKCETETSSSLSYDVKRISCVMASGTAPSVLSDVPFLPFEWTTNSQQPKLDRKDFGLRHGTGCNAWLSMKTSAGEAE